MFVIGTAGHVDHGKSALVKALTGVDPDRFEEEKRRGLTIDLGFAELTLPSGRRTGIVDVPGHEAFIKNMLAGVAGIDLALLIVAADEGIGAQTREHLAILDLLQVPRALVVLTKSDLAQASDLEWRALEAADLLAATRFAGAPVVACSARSGDGLDAMLAAIDAALPAEDAASQASGNPRLPIDRVFTLAGQGTIVTGTLIEGPLRDGQEVELLPARPNRRVLTARVKELQHHGRKVETALPGARTAVNLGNVHVDDLARGQVLTTPGWLRPAVVLDVRLRLLATAPHALRHNSMVTLHHFAAETQARVSLPQSGAIEPGSESWAELRLTRPLPVVSGDRFVLRSSETTLGGGEIVTALPRRQRLARRELVATLERQQQGGPRAVLLDAVRRREPAPLPPGGTIAGLSAEQTADALAALTAAGELLTLGEGENRIALTREGFERLSAQAVAAVEAFHEQAPHLPGLPREEVRSRLGLSTAAFAELLTRLVDNDQLAVAGAFLALPGRQPRLSAEAQAQAAAYLAALRAEASAPITSPPSPEVLRYLIDRGAVVRLDDGTVFAAEAYERMVDLTVGLIRRQGDASLAEVRDLLGTSRRYVQPFLEQLDRRRVTLRRGDRRVLRDG